ncbi:D-alanyl-D-alanine carboxypeptidase/D-alanyl-D-alanine endopeptidase [Streptomyces millisiae]|uniref:D-alanyl-D-alanine carboxypeptidase/D-alanyl-D-alanine-endopeptidase n=1 Tax=Streptomyces millisiae TaxID=3075542 RepID=A0ABU2LZN4_9ACTN|nr:D-alanyl-D-alanine carboxypeptidase/D-alanyl-D-alanine-endopeptidase [Streptomyces sp. DSM 44918]MDT0323000.1 D-alanyl-D-alanine carboxypeptidase/D-alanyl-D-alanine-endopeptidase [Streptomyces sp. DSM 44918]
MVRRTAEKLEVVLRFVRANLREQQAIWRLVAAAGAAGLAIASVLVALAGPWDSGRRTAERDQATAADARRDADTGDGEWVAGTVPGVQPVLVPLDGEGAEPTAAVVDRVLRPLLRDPALGEDVAAAVIDLSSGESLYAERAGTSRAPASTVKIITAVAALDALGPDHRLATTVRWDEERKSVVLVGGGDPTLTADDLDDLAGDTARALADRGLTAEEVAYDVSLYPREQRHPIGVNDNIAVITPLQLNEGRLDDSTRGPAPRADNPAADAATAFAAALADAGGISAEAAEGRDPARRTAPEDAEELAVHRSAPTSSLVERMLINSDNDLAEALARHTAIASDQPADFRGASAAFNDRLEALRLPMDGARLVDASGLDREGRVTADLLTRALAVAADPERPELRAALTGLPVAGFSGTLSERYADGETGAEGAGLVRAKTGTLTGVNSLAGTVATGEGRVLAFAFLASETTDARAAEAALDEAATALAALAG